MSGYGSLVLEGWWFSRFMLNCIRSVCGSPLIGIDPEYSYLNGEMGRSSWDNWEYVRDPTTEMINIHTFPGVKLIIHRSIRQSGKFLFMFGQFEVKETIEISLNIISN